MSHRSNKAVKPVWNRISVPHESEAKEARIAVHAFLSAFNMAVSLKSIVLDPFTTQNIHQMTYFFILIASVFSSYTLGDTHGKFLDKNECLFDSWLLGSTSPGTDAHELIMIYPISRI